MGLLYEVKKDGLVTKKCPFCGGEAELLISPGSHGYFPSVYYVRCKECWAEVSAEDSADIVVSRWNQRAGKQDG